MQFNYRSSSSSVGNDRLKKAIERNRAKQSKRTKVADSSPARVSVARSANESTFATPLKKKSTKKLFNLNLKTKKAKPITAPRRKKRAIGFTLPAWATKIAWAGCFFVVLRLVFADRGVVDYYSRSKIYDSYLLDKDQIIVENKNLVLEIEKIKKSKPYQKKLVRDHLGFISKDEFLVLFAKERVARAN